MLHIKNEEYPINKEEFFSLKKEEIVETILQLFIDKIITTIEIKKKNNS